MEKRWRKSFIRWRKLEKNNFGETEESLEHRSIEVEPYVRNFSCCKSHLAREKKKFCEKFDVRSKLLCEINSPESIKVRKVNFG